MRYAYSRCRVRVRKFFSARSSRELRRHTPFRLPKDSSVSTFQFGVFLPGHVLCVPMSIFVGSSKGENWFDNLAEGDKDKLIAFIAQAPRIQEVELPTHPR